MSEKLPPIDLRPDHWAIVRSILRQHVPDREILAFGSRATWNAKANSDLDLAILGDDRLSREESSALAEAFSESILPIKVDLVDWAAIDETFRNIIQRDGIAIQTSASKTEGLEWARQHSASSIDRTDKWPRRSVGECIVMNNIMYSPREAWPFVNYLDTGNITENRVSEIHHFVLGNDKLPSRARRKAQPGDIVFSTVRPIQRHFGLLKNTPENFLVSTGFTVFRGKKDIADTGFVYWFLTQDHIIEQLQIVAEHSTSAYPSIRPADIEILRIPIPPRHEQRAIAQVFETLDDKIELNRQMNETLESMARAIFKDWFVDFGPTRAKAEGHEPYLAPEIWDLFPDALDDEDKPVGWSICLVSDLFEFNPRESVKKGTYTPYLNMAALPTSGMVADRPIHREYKSGSKFRDGDTLFARITPCLENGKTAYVFDMGNDIVGTGSTEFIVIRSRTPLPTPASYFLARDPEFRAHAERSMTGTSGRQRASREALSQYELAAPTDDQLWKALGDYVTPMMDGIISNARESRALTQTRDLLLPKLMSGEIRVLEAVA